jgi:hypothetical protein
LRDPIWRNALKKVYLIYIGIGAVILFILLVLSSSLIISKASALNELPEIWSIIKVFKYEEYIPGIGYRTTVLLQADGYIRKAYCLDPDKPIPPVGTQCILDEKGIFHCGLYQRFTLLQEIATPTPTPEVFDCGQLGIGLYVSYGEKTTNKYMKSMDLASEKTNFSFSLDPLVAAPDEVWYEDPIHMVYPNRTCGRFTINGILADLPPEVVKVEVAIDCPGMHYDLSYEASDGGYCFDCRSFGFNLKSCTVSNRLYIQKDNLQFICQGFYKVIDPPK